MKVLIIGSNPYSIGGTENHIRTLSEGLIKSNIDVKIITYNNNRKNDRLKVTSTVYEFPNRITRLNQFYLFPSFLKFLIKTIKVFDPDIIDIKHSLFFGINAYIFKYFRKIPILGTLMGWGYDYTGVKSVINPMADIIIKKYDYIIYWSPFLKRIVNRLSIEGEYIPVCTMDKKNIIDYDEGKIFDDKSYIIGFVGRLDKIRGINILINFINYTRKHNKIKFKIFLSGSNSEIWKFINSINNPNAKIYQNMNTDEILEFYRNNEIHLLFNPVLTHGLGHATIEAMAYGIPSLMFNNWIREPLISNNNVFLISLKPIVTLNQRLYQSVYNIKNNSKKYNKISKNCIITIQREFTTDKMITKFINAYRRTIHDF